MYKRIKSSNVNLEEKIQQTKLETEKLKRELANLIHSNLNRPAESTTELSNHDQLKSSGSDSKFPTENDNKVQIIRSYDHQNVASKNSISIPTGVDPGSPKKSKAYDVQKAREYIKKQKEKRREELKHKKKETITADIRKQKLKELEKKSRQLVAKNVQIKRERSKSRDPPLIRSKSVDLNAAFCTPSPEKKKANLELNSNLDISARYGSNELVTEHLVHKSELSQQSRSGKDPNLLYPPKPSYGKNVRSSDTSNVHSTDLLTKHSINTVHNVDIGSHTDLNENSESKNDKVVKENNQRVNKIFYNLDFVENSKKTTNLEANIVPKKDKICIISDKLVKPGAYSIWLKDSSPQTDPYNIINTMNRQLKYVTENSKNHLVDVGIQNSLSREESLKKHEKTKSFSEHSGSDTSKNIPSIISESNSKWTYIPSFSSDNIDKTVHGPTVNIKNLEAPNTRLNSNNNNKPHTITSEDYSANFSQESRGDINIVRKNLFVDDNLDELERLDKSRKSIIAHNRASPTVSPNISPHVDKIQETAQRSLKKSRNNIPTLSTEAQDEAFLDTFSSKSLNTRNSRQTITSESVINTLETAFQKSSSFSLEPSNFYAKSRGEKSVEYFSLFPTLRHSNENDNPQETSNSISTKKSDEISEIPELVANFEEKNLSNSKRSASSIEEKIFQSKTKCIAAKCSTSFEDILSDSCKGSRNSIKEILKPKIKQQSQISDSASTEILSEDSKRSIKELKHHQFQNSNPSVEKMLTEHSRNSNRDTLTSKFEQSIVKPTKSEKNTTQNGSNNFENEPKLSVKMSQNKKDRNSLMKNISVRSSSNEDRMALMKNVSIRSSDTSGLNLNATQNEIHLKFEAEIHLLNDFNQSLQQFSEIEKEFISLRSKNDSDKTVKKTLQDRDTQTSVMSKTGSRSLDFESNASRSQMSFINFSRGSGTKPEFDLTINEDLTDNLPEIDSVLIPSESAGDSTVNSIVSVRENSLSRFVNGTAASHGRDLEGIFEKNTFKTVAMVSLTLFDQMLKDEDSRLENLKLNLKIRKQALLDRTKLELSSLEAQKRQLQRNQRLEEVSDVRRRQRGVLLRLQQEQHEIQRLKQMQNEKTQKRKDEIKEQRRLIKNQLYTDKMLSKLKLTRHRERGRSIEPLKVVQRTLSEAVKSETSLVDRQVALASDNEIRTVSASRSQSTVHILSEISDNNAPLEDDRLDRDIEKLGKTLLMRQQALDKQRKAAEELLQWHKKLIEEEKAIANLKETAKSIVFQTASDTNLIKNRGITNLKRNLSESDVITISQDVAFDRINSSSDNVYSTDFEPDSAAEKVNHSRITSISQLIDDFSKIQHEISTVHTSLEEIEGQHVESVSKHSSQIKEVIDDLPSQVQDSEKDTNTSSHREPGSTPITEKTSEDPILEEEEPKSLTEIIQSLKSTLESEKITEDLKSENEGAETSLKTQIKDSKDVSIVPQESSVVTSIPNVVDESLDEDSSKNNKSLEGPLINENIIIVSESGESEKVTELEEETIPSPELDLNLQEAHDTSISTEDQESGTSKQVEDLSEDVVSPLSKEARTSFIEEKEHDSMSSESASESQKIKSIVLVEEKSLENKTDEEKAASIKNSNQTEPEPRRFTLSEEYAAQINASNNVPSSFVKSDNSSSSSSISTEKAPSIKSKSADVTENSLKSLKSLDLSLKNMDLSPKTMDLSPKSPKKSLKTCSTEARSPRLLEDRSPRGNVDVRKRVLEILGEANSTVSRGDKSPRMQDLCVMTYDLASPLGSPEAGPSKEALGNEAQELLRKQLAIEQEIKLLTAQAHQQKEPTPPSFVREIPNKPPPPYKPPAAKSPKKTTVDTVIPKSREIEEIATYSAKIIHKAYLTNNLENISISDNTLNLIAKDINKDCFKFVFDLCKEISIGHYGQFKKEDGPSWLNLETPSLFSKPLDVQGLEKLLKQKLTESFGYQKPTVRHSAIINWSKKKLKDKVDTVVIQEMYAEESSWNNFEQEEVLMKNRVFNQIFQKLFDEALKDYVKAFEAKYSNSRN